MIEMKQWAAKAAEKLEKEKPGVKGQKESAMAPAVMAALKDFSQQSEEFAQAVVKGGSFVRCMTEVAKGIGYAISDLDVYKRAVEFYFPGAEIKMELTIYLKDETDTEDKGTSGGGLVLDFSSIL